MLRSSLIAPHLPYVRRFARALLGSQSAGDACVAATLESVLADPSALDGDGETRVALYRLFLKNLSQGCLEHAPDGLIDVDTLAPFRKLSAIPEQPRIAFLLNSMEDFSLAETARIMDVSLPIARALISEAGRQIAAQLRTDVLIIEDEPLIALDLKKLLQQLGHCVVTVARTRDEAVQAAREHRPGLILSDIMLADGSSGLDAINDILTEWQAPVIFITAFPHQLLTGRAPEPTFFIAKPFSRDAVQAVVSQALFFDQKCHATGPEAEHPKLRLPASQPLPEGRAEEL
jgi:CheY-like chemotaxis protein